MRAEPPVKRTVVFVDGQNLFYAVKLAFGYPFPNYDVLALSRAVCEMNGWRLAKARFYTGLPRASDNPFWNQFWTAKLAVMGTRGMTEWKSLLLGGVANKVIHHATCPVLLVR